MISVALIWRGARGAWLRDARLRRSLLLGLVRSQSRAGEPAAAQGHRRGRRRPFGEPGHRRAAAARRTRRATRSRRGSRRSATSTCGSSRPRARNRTPRGRSLFAALRGALSDAPPERVGGAIMITDGDAHDIPAVGGRARLQRAAACADHRPRRRAAAADRADRGAALRHRRQGSGRSPRASSTAPTTASRSSSPCAATARRSRRSTPRSASGSTCRRRSSMPAST